MDIPKREEIIKMREERGMYDKVPQTTIDLLKNFGLANSYKEYLAAIEKVKLAIEKLVTQEDIIEIQVPYKIKSKKLAEFIKEEIEKKWYFVRIKEHIQYHYQDLGSWVDGYYLIISI